MYGRLKRGVVIVTFQDVVGVQEVAQGLCHVVVEGVAAQVDLAQTEVVDECVEQQRPRVWRRRRMMIRHEVIAMVRG